jgi:hypothetical protein
MLRWFESPRFFAALCGTLCYVLWVLVFAEAIPGLLLDWHPLRTLMWSATPLALGECVYLLAISAGAAAGAGGFALLLEQGDTHEDVLFTTLGIACLGAPMLGCGQGLTVFAQLFLLTPFASLSALPKRRPAYGDDRETLSVVARTSDPKPTHERLAGTGGEDERGLATTATFPATPQPVPVHTPRMQEEWFQSVLHQAVVEYMRERHERRVVVRTPSATQQAKMKVDTSYCFDLIARISTSRLLLLELKWVESSDKVRSADLSQERLLVALRNKGVPVLYAYNARQEYPDDDTASEQLSTTRTASPGRFSGPDRALIHVAEHRVLRDVVDELAAPSANGATGGAAWADGRNVVHLFDGQLLNIGLQQFTTKFLLFAYNVEAKELITLTAEQLSLVYDAYVKVVRLQRDLDLNAPQTEIDQLFTERLAELDRLLKELPKPQQQGISDGNSPEREAPGNPRRPNQSRGFDFP